MNRASPAEIRKGIVLAKLFAREGIAFVPVPYFDEETMNQLLRQKDEILEAAAKKAEEEESK